MEGRLPAPPEVDLARRPAYSARVYKSTQFRRSPVKKFVPAALSILLLCALPGQAQTSPDGATYSQIRDMAVRAYRAVHGATGTLAQVEATASAAVQTNDPAYLAALTNGEQGVVLGLASGSTVVDAAATQEPVSFGQVLDLVAGASEVTLHGSMGNNFFGTPGALIDEAHPVTVVITNTITSNGYALVGTFWDDTATDEVSDGEYVLRWYSRKTAGNRNVYGCARLVTRLNGAAAATNGISALSTEITASAVPNQYRITPYQTNAVAGTQVVFGVEYYIYSTNGSQNTPVLTYLGLPYDAHLETPGLGTVNLGVRGATNVVLTGYTCVYDAVARTLTLTAN